MVLQPFSRPRKPSPRRPGRPPRSSLGDLDAPVLPERKVRPICVRLGADSERRSDRSTQSVVSDKIKKKKAREREELTPPLHKALLHFLASVSFFFRRSSERGKKTQQHEIASPLSAVLLREPPRGRPLCGSEALCRAAATRREWRGGQQREKRGRLCLFDVAIGFDAASSPPLLSLSFFLFSSSLGAPHSLPRLQGL